MAKWAVEVETLLSLVSQYTIEADEQTEAEERALEMAKVDRAQMYDEMDGEYEVTRPARLLA